MIEWLLTVYGITVILTWSHIAKPWRALVAKLGEHAEHFSKCAMCVSWWVGLYLSAALDLGPMRHHLLNAFAASAGAWIIHVTLKNLGMDNA